MTLVPMGAHWQPIEAAPRDGTPIQADIPPHGQDYVIAWVGGYVDGDGRECAAWTIIEDQEPPPCWTDGVCWETNDDNVTSAQPTRWKPLTD